MEQARVHFRRARVLRSLSEAHAAGMNAFADWEIVCRFYSALHFVQAYLMTKGHRFDAKRHYERIEAIRASPELAKDKRFLSRYRQLQDVSEQVRYDPGFIAGQMHVESARENLRFVENVLEPKLPAEIKAAP